jgi:TonB family protein
LKKSYATFWTIATFLVASTFFLPAQAAETSPCAPPKTIVTTFRQPPYPTASQRDDESGTTFLEITVAPDGGPTDFVVTRSSGSKRLDDAASSFAMSKYRWEKAPDGCLAVRRPITIIWQLGNPPKADAAVLAPLSNYPADALRLEELGDAYLTLSLGDGGTLKDVHIVYSSGYPELDNQSIAIVKASPNLTAGKAAGPFTLLFRWKLPPELNGNRITITSRVMHMADAGR